MKTKGSHPKSKLNLHFQKALSEFRGEVNKVVELIAETFKEGEYAIIGGLALRTYFDGARPLTPDIDLLVSPLAKSSLSAFLRKVDSKKSYIFLGSAWYITEKGNIKVDVKIADKEYEIESLREVLRLTFQDSTIFVVSPEHLALMKMDSLREKDEKDLLILFRMSNFDHEKFKQLLRKYMPEKTDEYRQLRLLLEFLTKKAQKESK